MPRYSANINVMMNAVRKASRGIMRDFGEVEKLQVSKKGPNDFVSAADIKAEEILYEELSKARPQHGFVLEESGKIKGKDSEYRWLVDPLDGTNNFLHGLPLFCSAVALERKISDTNREIVAAVVIAPAQQEIFWAEKGEGAWLESGANSGINRLRVSARTKINEAMLCSGSMKSGVEATAKLLPNVASIRSLGSTVLALAYVAAGRFDGFFQATPKMWDIGAGMLMIKEAGGGVSDYTGKHNPLVSDSILASNEYLHMPLVKALKQSNKSLNH